MKENGNQNITPILLEQWFNPSDGTVHFRYKEVNNVLAYMEES